ncbi:MAG TPA: hypothetical protein VIB98_01405 [Gemmatimonadaceae bacterium]
MNRLQLEENPRMHEPFDTTSIPETVEYWDALARRVTLAAVAAPAASQWLTRGGARWIAAASLVFAASLVLALLAVRPVATTSNAYFAAAILPRDAVGRSFASRDGPPSVIEVLAATAQEAAR